MSAILAKVKRLEDQDLDTDHERLKVTRQSYKISMTTQYDTGLYVLRSIDYRFIVSFNLCKPYNSGGDTKDKVGACMYNESIIHDVFAVRKRSHRLSTCYWCYG